MKIEITKAVPGCTIGEMFNVYLLGDGTPYIDIAFTTKRGGIYGFEIPLELIKGKYKKCIEPKCL